jgi:L-rhamnose mutarotase
LSDWHWEIRNLVVDGDYIAGHFAVTSTHRRAFQEIEATGRRVTISEFTFYRLEDGKFAEVWDLADMEAVMRQIARARYTVDGLSQLCDRWIQPIEQLQQLVEQLQQLVPSSASPWSQAERFQLLPFASPKPLLTPRTFAQRNRLQLIHDPGLHPSGGDAIQVVANRGSPNSALAYCASHANVATASKSLSITVSGPDPQGSSMG